jgi:hypothetical protein
MRLARNPPPAGANLEIARLIGDTYDDPFAFVMLAYPWGEPGELAGFEGPDRWQREVLEDLGREVRARGFDGVRAVVPIRMATASGHGIGKSTLVAWIVNWIMSTRPHCQGTITANTYQQLETKTWAAILKWTRLCITSSWFLTTGNRIYHRDYPETWFCAAQSCREENSEAFAGQHAVSSTSFYLFDEASAIPDKIFEVAEGGLTDGEPMIFLFGNPTRNTGKFYRCTYGSERDRWRVRSIDSRECALPNKAQIEEWITDYGEDSDFVRVRVRGLPPRASELQFIDQERVWQAQKRQVITLPNEPLIAGVDVSGGGAAWNVVRYRRGHDARSIPPIRIPGEHTRNDRGMFLAKLADVLSVTGPNRVSMMFIDSAFGAPYVERLHILGYRDRVMEVNFGGQSPDAHQANMRAHMWNQMKDWLLTGAIPERDTVLEIGLIGPGFHMNRQNQLVIESKQDMAKRGIASPDDADALALTFARRVAPPPIQEPRRWHQPPHGRNAWMTL